VLFYLEHAIQDAGVTRAGERRGGLRDRSPPPVRAAD
jgi:hypothetical protein